MKLNMLQRVLRFGRSASVVGLTVLSIMAIVSPAFAVVFTNPASITINDAAAIGIANPYSSTINVSGTVGTITNVTVTLNNFNHTFPDDLDVMVVAPGGNNLVVMSDAGGSADVTNTTLTFDDAAAAAITDGGPLGGGTFKPSQYVAGDIFPAPAPAASANTTLAASFNGISANGTWELFAVDDTGIDMGTYGNGWSVTVTTTGTAATTFSNNAPIFLNERFGKTTVYPSPIVVSGLTGAITDVNVTLTNVNHLNPDDLDVVLVSPTGKRILLMSDTGGTTDLVGVNITLDDAAATALPDATVIATGSFRPANFATGDTMQDLLPPISSAGTGGGGTLASVFNGTEPNGTWNLYINDDATASAGTITSGWSLDITAGGSFGAKRFTSGDFNGDGQTDVSIYRPSDSNWWTRSSSTYSNSAVKWGAAGDVAVPSDYDGDGKTDMAIFRPSTGYWIVTNSATSTVTFSQWGVATDTPVQSDFDGDGKADLAVYRSGEGNWYVRDSSTSSVRVVNWGLPTDLPLRGHFEGTNGADFAVFRPSDNNWYILNNAASSYRIVGWGASGDKPAPADYDADGKTDIAVFRPSVGDWYILQSSTTTLFGTHWGQNGDIAVPGDYDGDSRADLAVWRPGTGTWYIVNSGTTFGAASQRLDSWGLNTDIAIPSTYLPPQ